MSNTDLISIERIEQAIYIIRGQKVMLDRDLAKLYEVPTGALNQAVRRNRERFPADFMFQLTSAEVAELNLSQIVIGSEFPFALIYSNASDGSILIATQAASTPEGSVLQ